MTTQARAELVKAWQANICLDDIVGDMVNSVKENLKPEDVFNDKQLGEWAEENDYTKSE